MRKRKGVHIPLKPLVLALHHGNLQQTKRLVVIPRNDEVDHSFRTECLLKETMQKKIIMAGIKKARHDVLKQIRDDRILEVSRERKVIKAAEKTRKSENEVFKTCL